MAIEGFSTDFLLVTDLEKPLRMQASAVLNSQGQAT